MKYKIQKILITAIPINLKDCRTITTIATTIILALKQALRDMRCNGYSPSQPTYRTTVLDLYLKMMFFWGHGVFFCK